LDDFIVPLLLLEDNYTYVLLDAGKERAVVVDPSDGERVWAYLQAQGLELEAILATHHHLDHVAGVDFLCGKKDVPVYSSADEKDRISRVTRGLVDGEKIELCGRVIQALQVPGHTLGHLVYLTEGELFCGDALFLGGCGRLFEGTAAQMFDSLYGKIMPLPDNTRVYPGHEYTVRTRSFCLSVDPENPLLQRELTQARKMRDQDLPTVPGRLQTERETNVFLRCQDPVFVETVQRQAPNLSKEPLAVFTHLRSMMDVY